MNQGRHVGVRVPTNQSTEQAPVMTVTQVAIGTPVLVEYGDERGIKHTVMGFRFGEKVFIPPNGESWTDGFRPFAGAINEQIIAKLQEVTPGASAAVPADAVDIAGGIGDALKDA